MKVVLTALASAHLSDGNTEVGRGRPRAGVADVLTLGFPFQRHEHFPIFLLPWRAGGRVGASDAVALERPLASPLALAWLGSGVRLLPPVCSLRKHLLSPSGGACAGCGGSAAAAPALASRAGKGLRPTRDSRKRRADPRSARGVRLGPSVWGLLVGKCTEDSSVSFRMTLALGPGSTQLPRISPLRQAGLGRPRA